MESVKAFQRRKFLSIRKRKYSPNIKFNFNPIFFLINKIFSKKKPNIACYYPSYYEANTLEFIQSASKKNYNILLPFVKKNNKMSFKLWIYKDPLNINKFGMMEPKKSNKDMIPDIILVPLVAFDRNLNRIGYGGGYYDRVLQKIVVKKKIITIGLAYSFQYLKKISTGKHDVKLNYILTEKGFINSKSDI